MSTIRIFSKKAFAIGPGASRDGNGVEQFITVPNAIQDMPEKYSDDPTFKLACSVGDIQVMNGNVSVNIPVVSSEKSFDENEDAENDSVEQFYEELKTKNKDEVKELAKKYNAEFIESDKLSLNKKRVFEAYKISISEEK